MAKLNDKRIHGGMAILFATVMVNAIFVEFVDAKSTKYRKNIYLGQRKGVVKTIKSHESDDVIDCVDIYKQPAFDHPLLKNHTIQMKPTTFLKGTKIKKFRKKIFAELDCPEGTIPIKRIQNHISNQASPRISKQNLYDHHTNDAKVRPGRNYEYARVFLKDADFCGASASINVWRPTTDSGEASFSQIWVATDDRYLNTVEAGWMVNSMRGYGNQTRFFTFWTADSYNSTGCYNLECPGFVQVSKNYLLEAPISPISEYNSRQYEINIAIYQDQKTKNWWLQRENIVLGYWPASIFTNLSIGARTISWGGEIVILQSLLRNTTTQMGSGDFPSEGYGKASYFAHLKYINASGNQMDADGVNPYVSIPSSYDVQLKEKIPQGGVYFYYGGPRHSPHSAR